MVRIHTHIGSVCVAAFVLAASAAAQTPKQYPPVSTLPGPAPVAVGFCFGDGSVAPCPCDNTGAPGRGCQNSALTGGAQLWASGLPAISRDTLQLDVSGELPTAMSLLLQGTVSDRPAMFGDGLRCVGGTVTRLYTQNAIGGMVSIPAANEPPITVRSTMLGDRIAPGDQRFYQVYYRDPRAAFCGPPVGGGFNLSNAIAVVWTK